MMNTILGFVLYGFAIAFITTISIALVIGTIISVFYLITKRLPSNFSSLGGWIKKQPAKLKTWVRKIILVLWAKRPPLKPLYIVLATIIALALLVLFIGLYWEISLFAWNRKLPKGLNVQNLALAFLGTVSAFGALFGVYMAILRSETTERQTHTAEQELIADSINKANEGLGKNNQKDDPVIEARVGALYALEQAARDSERDHIRIMKTICAYIRISSPRTDEMDEEEETEIEISETDEETQVSKDTEPDKKQKMREDIHEAITIIGRRDDWSEGAKRIKQERLKGYCLDLNQCYLRGAQLERADLCRANLERTNLCEANLERATLTSSNLEKADLNNATLNRADMTYAKLFRANLNDATLIRADLSSAKLERASLIDARLNRVNLTRAMLDGANLNGAWLDNSIINHALLTIANLSYTRLRSVEMCSARLSRANLSNARILRANLSESRLDRVNLSEAWIGGTDLSNTWLNGANITKTIFEDANMKNANTNLVYAHEGDLSGCLNLTQKQIDVMFCGKDVEIPDNLERPKHWLTDDLSYKDFMASYTKWSRIQNPRLYRRRILTPKPTKAKT